jgi:hypothetical protein
VMQFVLRHRRTLLLLAIAVLVMVFVALFLAGHGAVSGGTR